MMKKIVFTCTLLAVLTGCVAAPRGAIIHGVLSDANLALGPSAEHNILGEALAGRSDWPYVEHGYVFDDVSVYYQYQYNDESFYEDQAGGFYRESEAVRTGVRVH